MGPSEGPMSSRGAQAALPPEPTARPGRHGGCCIRPCEPHPDNHPTKGREMRSRHHGLRLTLAILLGAAACSTNEMIPQEISSPDDEGELPGPSRGSAVVL